MKYLAIIGLVITLFSGVSIQAQIVEVSFTGEVIIAGSDGDINVPALVGGGAISLTDSVSGILRFDSTASPDLVEPAGALYRTEAPYFYKVMINGIEFSNDGEFGIFVLNNNPGAGGDVDGFGLQDGTDPINNTSWFTGDTILINQQQRNAATSFTLTDLTASVYDSLELPTALELSDFHDVLRNGDILGNNENGVRFNITYRITSIEVSIVSEVLLGDCNQDGVVNFIDIAPFISILSTGIYLAEADANEDQVIDFFDISSFILLLSSS